VNDRDNVTDIRAEVREDPAYGAPERFLVATYEDGTTEDVMWLGPVSRTIINLDS
jgi:hypothetical protein